MDEVVNCMHLLPHSVTPALRTSCHPSFYLDQMPLSLRRSKKSTQSTHTSRAVSNPTLLHRLRSSAFNPSKTSLISTSGYDTVRARTPPRTDDPPQHDDRFAARRTRQFRAIHAGWRFSAQRLSKQEQRECLLGAECLDIVDPLEKDTGEPALQPVSIAYGIQTRQMCLSVRL